MVTARIGRPNIGLKRISARTPSAQTEVTRDIREQFEVLKDNLNKVIKGIEDITPEALKYGLLPIYEKSQYYCPVDTGRLRRSGYLEVKEKQRGRIIEAEVGYGRAGSPHYAVFVHEDLRMKHASPTQAKFLEQAINEHFDDIRPRIIEAIKAGTGIS